MKEGRRGDTCLVSTDRLLMMMGDHECGLQPLVSWLAPSPFPFQTMDTRWVEEVFAEKRGQARERASLSCD